MTEDIKYSTHHDCQALRISVLQFAMERAWDPDDSSQARCLEDRLFSGFGAQCFGFYTRLALILALQLRGNQKDFNFQLHHRLSKFAVPLVVNLEHNFELFGLYTTCFLIEKLLELIRLSSDGQFWRQSQNKKGGKFELRSQLC